MGGMLGALAIKFLNVGYDFPIDPQPYRNKIFQSIISECTGTFIFVLFFMISTDKKT